MKQNFRYESRYERSKKQKIQETVEYILSFNYGQTIQYETLSQKLGYNYDDEQEAHKFKSTMSRIKNFLIDYGYILKNIGRIGYYILKPKQISGYCYRTYVQRTFGLLEKSERILGHTKESELSDIRLKELNEMKVLNKSVQSSIGKTIKESAYNKNKHVYDNLKD